MVTRTRDAARVQTGDFIILPGDVAWESHPNVVFPAGTLGIAAWAGVTRAGEPMVKATLIYANGLPGPEGVWLYQNRVEALGPRHPGNDLIARITSRRRAAPVASMRDAMRSTAAPRPVQPAPVPAPARVAPTATRKRGNAETSAPKGRVRAELLPTSAAASLEDILDTW